MAIEDLNVANLLETKSNRAPRTESVPPFNERSNAPTKWIKAALVGTLATLFVIVTMGLGARRK
jgi:hypothetical protein